MKSTALGAENIIFISDAHEKFYYEKLQEVRYQDVYHKALCYCLGINGDTRKNADRIYNFKTGSVKTKCLHEGWQTSGSLKVVRMAFNLYCNSTPSVWDYEDAEEQVNECRQYEKDGFPAEKILLHIIRQKFLRPGIRVYRSQNLYDRIIEYDKLEKEGAWLEKKAKEAREARNPFHFLKKADRKK